MRMHEAAEADAAYSMVEHMKFLYPKKPSTKAGQFAAYMEECMDGVPLEVIPYWMGCVFRWLERPLVGEEDMFSDAISELRRLQGERRR